MYLFFGTFKILLCRVAHISRPVGDLCHETWIHSSSLDHRTCSSGMYKVACFTLRWVRNVGGFLILCHSDFLGSLLQWKMLHKWFGQDAWDLQWKFVLKVHKLHTQTQRSLGELLGSWPFLKITFFLKVYIKRELAAVLLLLFKVWQKHFY